MLRSTTSDSSCGIEVACLLPPWPTWLFTEELSSRPAACAVAQLVLSDDINDGIAAATACKLLTTLAGPDALVHVWLRADRAYRAQLEGVCGSAATVGLWPIVSRQMPEGYMTEDVDLSISPPLSDTQALESDFVLEARVDATCLSRLGFPATFLSIDGLHDRVAVGCLPAKCRRQHRFPSYNLALAAHDFIVFPGGPHLTDCIFASDRMPREALSRRVVEAAAAIGCEADYIGMVEGDSYERCRMRGTVCREMRFRDMP